MSTISYSITRGGGLLTANNNNPQPVVYIKPDMDLINFAMANENKLLVSISETNLPYENKKLLAVLTVDPKRPNYFNQSGYYMIVLVSDWYGEPEDMSKLGKINIHGFQKVELDNSSSPSSSLNQLNSIMNEFNSKGKISPKLFFIMILVCLLVGMIIYMYKSNSKDVDIIQQKDNRYAYIKPKYF
jgi:hypothetical protein